MIFTLEPPGIDPLDVSLSATRARAEHLRDLSLKISVVLGTLGMLAALIGLKLPAVLLLMLAMTASGVAIGFSQAAYGIAVCEIWSDNGGRRVR